MGPGKARDLLSYAPMWISLQDITIQVGAARRFAGTSWQIEPGENWAILGPTGSGKTTLARALCRQLPLVTGQIRFYFDPTEPEGRPFLKPKEVAVLSSESHQDFLRHYADYHQARWQSFEGDEAPSVAGLFAASQAAEAPAARSDEILRLLKLEPLLARRVLHLSHGESRKVHLARLWLSAPRLLILDDPYVGLDADSRAVLAQAIETLAAQGGPQVLLISSRPDEIPAGIHKVLLVADNRVVAQGQRQAMLAQAAGLFAAGAQPAQAGPESPAPALREALAVYERALQANPVSALPELVRMEGVSVTYGDTPVLRQVTWTVRPGERWALLGHNGAGKSTLLSLVLGDNPQSYNNLLYLFGRRRGSGESIWEIKRNIGWVSPELQIYYSHDATCRGVITSGFFDSVGLYRRPSPEQAALAEGWLRAFELESLAGKPFHALSAGQQRLALLARALVKDPPLLVLDEPCQGLDEAHRRRFIDLLDALCAHTPVSLVYVTHYRDELPRAVTHQLRLDHGSVV